MAKAHEDQRVAVFAGATAGIGEAVLKAYATSHPTARVYFIGRNEQAAKSIIQDVKTLRSQGCEGESEEEDFGKVVFIRADLSLLKNCHDVIGSLKKYEGEAFGLDLLYMSQGYLTLKGRQETSEFLDAPSVLQFYSRAYLTYLLLPHLHLSHSQSQFPNPRVISIHGNGHEGPLWLEDLGLENRHSSWLDWIFPAWWRKVMGLDPGYTRARFVHTIVMTNLFFEELARREKEGGRAVAADADPEVGKGKVSFLSIYPGLVRTHELATGDFPAWLSFLLYRIMLPMMRPFTVSPETVGECVVRIAEDGGFGVMGVLDERNEGREELAIGSDRVRGSGAYAVDRNGKRKIKDGVMRALRDKGAREKVWEFYMGVFERVVGEREDDGQSIGIRDDE